LQSLSADTMATVTADFIRFEQDYIGAGVHERLHALAESLIAAWPPADLPVIPFAGCGCSGSHC
jgi:hypothetical protein